VGRALVCVGLEGGEGGEERRGNKSTGLNARCGC